MRWRLRFWVRPRDEDISEEIEAHLRMAVAERVERGESQEEARRAARLELGNATLVKERTRSAWQWTAAEQIVRDLHIAVRRLAQSPGFAITVVVLLALGIGTNSAIFSMFNTVLLKPMPAVEGKRLVSLGVTFAGAEADPGNSYANYQDYAAQSQTIRGWLARGFARVTLGLENASYALRAGLVTPNYFRTLGVRFVKGRGPAEGENLEAVIGYRVWQEQFEGAENVVGRRVVVNGIPAVIVGVAAPRFRGIQVGERQDVWLPILTYSRIEGTEQQLLDRANRRIEIVGQLAPGVTLADAGAELELISKRLESEYPKANERLRAPVVPYTAMGPGVQMARRLFHVLLAVSVLVLFVICANVINLVLARAVARQREMSIRQSLGAGRGRLFRLLFAEGLVLALTAALLAWLAGSRAATAIPHLIPDGPNHLDWTPDWRVVAYAVALAVGATLLFTAVPAVRAMRLQPLEWLKAGEHTIVPSGRRLSNALVVIQIGLCVVLLTGAGLLYRSSMMVDGFDPGFRMEGLLFARVETAGAADDGEENGRLVERVRERLRSVPGVSSVSYARIAPLSWRRLSHGGVRSSPDGEAAPADWNFVGPEFFRTLGAPIQAGRGITALDRAGSPRVAVINQRLAEILWPGEIVLGKTLFLPEDESPVAVVGVVANGAYSDVRRGATQNTLFVPFQQHGQRTGAEFHLRYTGELDHLTPALRAAVHEVEPQAPIAQLRTARAQLEDSHPLTFVAALVTPLALGALVLAGIGLYAVIAFNTARRVKEFAVRLALGASERQVSAGVFREGLLLTSIGLAAGLALSVAGGRALGSFLFGVTPTDGATYAFVLVILGLTSCAACLLPARRAMRVEPARALRQE